ncbi:MAG: thermonuclease family protein [Candidatus Aenigmarchaeota archaeon]|nr:thermonuclease family protein [Candidatus Aenigmarchaeota archaeon]
MKKSIKIFFIILAIAFVVTNYMEQYKEQRVTDVIDGDTIKIGYASIRLIGINAPEKNEECYKESKELLQELVLYKKVMLEKDRQDTDDYGRLLRYVYVEDMLVNKEMVRLGMARFEEVGLNKKHSENILEAQEKAQNARRCIWV